MSQTPRFLITTEEIQLVLRCGRTSAFEVSRLIKILYPASAHLHGKVRLKDFCSYHDFPEADIQDFLRTLS